MIKIKNIIAPILLIIGFLGVIFVKTIFSLEIKVCLFQNIDIPAGAAANFAKLVFVGRDLSLSCL